MKKNLLKTIITCVATLCLCAYSATAPATTEGGNTDAPAAGDATINIAYQYGLAYAPLIVCMNNKLIEEKYKEATGADVTVTWTQMSSGADINTGIASGQFSTISPIRVSRVISISRYSPFR